MMMIVTFFFHIISIFGFIYVICCSPNSSGFLTLLVSASNLASLGAVRSREGLGGAFVASRCWLLVFVEVQLIPSSKMTSIHLYIYLCFFFLCWFSGALRGML